MSDLSVSNKSMVTTDLLCSAFFLLKSMGCLLNCLLPFTVQLLISSFVMRNSIKFNASFSGVFADCSHICILVAAIMTLYLGSLRKLNPTNKGKKDLVVMIVLILYPFPAMDAMLFLLNLE